MNIKSTFQFTNAHQTIENSIYHMQFFPLKMCSGCMVDVVRLIPKPSVLLNSILPKLIFFQTFRNTVFGIINFGTKKKLIKHGFSRKSVKKCILNNITFINSKKSIQPHWFLQKNYFNRIQRLLLPIFWKIHYKRKRIFALNNSKYRMMLFPLEMKRTPKPNFRERK